MDVGALQVAKPGSEFTEIILTHLSALSTDFDLTTIIIIFIFWLMYAKDTLNQV